MFRNSHGPNPTFFCCSLRLLQKAGGTLAYAGPDGGRGDTGLPFSGYITIDEADVANVKSKGAFLNIVEHEFGHLLGIGTYWSKRGVTGNSNNNCPYRGLNANREYRLMTGCLQIPTELDGGSGTKCSHFDDACMNNELMTGYVNYDAPNPLSRLTIASLQDLGYQVDYSEADSYGRANIASQCLCGLRRGLVATKHHVVPGTNSTSGKTLKRRKLSDGMKEYAIEQGRAILQKQKMLAAEQSLNARDGNDGDPNAPKFIGDQYVSVWVEDVDGSIFSVSVWAD